MIKEYPKEWEDVLTGQEILKKFDPAKADAKGYSLNDYGEVIRRTLKIQSDNFFQFAIIYYWLLRRFTYNGIWRKKSYGNHPIVDNAFATYMRNYIGMNHRVFTAGTAFRPIASYIPDFFPDFDKNNPVENPEKFKFPYKYVTIDFMYFVWEMDERLDLLDIAEKRKFTYAVFADYVINYVYSLNEEKGKDVYQICINRNAPYHIMKIKRRGKC